MSSDPTLLHLRADLGAFHVTGGDRLTWLNGLVTQDVGKLAPSPAGGGGAYGLAVGKTGKIMAELWFIATADRILVIAPKDRLALLLEHFDKHLIMEDAELSPPLDCAVVFAHGPQSSAIVAQTRAAGGDAALVDWTDRAAAVLVAPDADPGPLVAALLAGGSPRALASDPDWEALRITWGLPRSGVDYDDQTLPQEASLEKATVCFTKGCYLGKRRSSWSRSAATPRRGWCASPSRAPPRCPPAPRSPSPTAWPWAPSPAPRPPRRAGGWPSAR